MNLLAQLLSRIVVSPADCWEWQGCKLKSGYGKKGVRGKTKLVHRLMWEITHQMEVPEGLFVLHKCDNPKCCNPDHLFIGTQADNVRDCIAKGRKKDTVKYDDSLVKAVRKMYSGKQSPRGARTGLTHREIAARTGVSREHVGALVRGTFRKDH